MLSTLSLFYDPLGLASPFILRRRGIKRCQKKYQKKLKCWEIISLSQRRLNREDASSLDVQVRQFKRVTSHQRTIQQMMLLKVLHLKTLLTSLGGFRDHYFYGSYLGWKTQIKVRSVTARVDFSRFHIQRFFLVVVKTYNSICAKIET